MPSSTTTMNDLKIFLDLIKANISFGYAHFNDGEIWSIGDCPEGGETDWGWQNCSRKLSNAMLNALRTTAPQFYIGIPCLCEFHGDPYFKALKYLNITHEANNNPPLKKDVCPEKPPVLTFPSEEMHPYLKERLSIATAFINGNFEIAKKSFKHIFNKISKKGRRVYVVCGEGHSTSRLGFPVYDTFHAKKRHAFDHDYPTMRTQAFLHTRGYRAGDVVLIMLGPLGRILASEWSLLRHDVTFMDLGSFFDVEMWNRPGYITIGEPKNCMYVGDTKVRHEAVEKMLKNE